MLCAALGVILIGIGLLLLLAPERGEMAFGTRVREGRSYAFHHASGVREAYFGLLILLLAVLRELRALGWVLVTIAVVPLGDFLIAATAPDGSFARALVHLPSIPLVVVTGLVVLRWSSMANGLRAMP